MFEPLEHKIKRRNKNDKNLCICDLLKLVENSKSILFPLLYTLKSLYYALYCVVLVKREAFNSSLSHSICIGIAGSCINVSTEKNLLCFVWIKKNERERKSKLNWFWPRDTRKYDIICIVDAMDVKFGVYRDSVQQYNYEESWRAVKQKLCQQKYKILSLTFVLYVYVCGFELKKWIWFAQVVVVRDVSVYWTSRL